MYHGIYVTYIEYYGSGGTLLGFIDYTRGSTKARDFPRVARLFFRALFRVFSACFPCFPRVFRVFRAPRDFPRSENTRKTRGKRAILPGFFSAPFSACFPRVFRVFRAFSAFSARPGIFREAKTNSS